MVSGHQLAIAAIRLQCPFVIQYRGYLFIQLISPISLFSTGEMKCLRVVTSHRTRTGGGIGVRSVKEHMCCNGKIGLSGRRTARPRGQEGTQGPLSEGREGGRGLRGGGLIERGSFALCDGGGSSSAAPAAVDPSAHVAWRGALPLRYGRPPSFLPSFFHSWDASKTFQFEVNTDEDGGAQVLLLLRLLIARRLVAPKPTSLPPALSLSLSFLSDSLTQRRRRMSR